MEAEHERFDRILPRWYSEGILMSTSDPEFLGWIQKQSPDVWHKIICSSTDADDSKVTKWIVSHPDCDLGTAVNLFRLDAINFDCDLAKLSPAYHDQWHAIKICEERMLSDDFKTKELAPELLYNGMGLPSGNEQFTVPEVVRTFTGTRGAISDFVLSGGQLMLSLDAFCRSIGEQPLDI